MYLSLIFWLMDLVLRHHFYLPKVIIQVQTGLEYSAGGCGRLFSCMFTVVGKFIPNDLQVCRDGARSENMGGIICPPGCYRDNWSAKLWGGGRAPSLLPRFRHPWYVCRWKYYMSRRKYRFPFYLIVFALWFVWEWLYIIGWADKECSSTNHKYNKFRPSSRLTKGIAKYFLVFEMILAYNSVVLILKLKIRISRHY